MDLKQLRYFVGICDAGSITRAAKILGIAQPALSNHVSTMEVRLGVELLHRSSHGVIPTESGEILYAAAQRIMRDVSRLQEEVKLLDLDPSGKVVIGVAEAPNNVLGHLFLEKMFTSYPNIELYYSSNQSIELHQKLVRGVLDIGLYYKEADIKGADSKTLVKEQLFIIMPCSGHEPELQPIPLKPEELSSLPFIFPRKTHFSMRSIVEKSFGGLDLTPQVIAEVDSFVMLKKFVAQGHACSILPWSAVHEEFESGAVMLRTVEGANLYRNIELCLPLDRPQSITVKATCRIVVNVIRELIQSGKWQYATLDKNLDLEGETGSNC